MEILEEADGGGVAHADRAAEADGEADEPVVGGDLGRSGRPPRGAQAQPVALEHVALAGVGLEEPAGGERDRRVEPLRVEGLEGACRGVEARQRRALVGHPPLQLVLGLGGGHESHRLVGQLLLEPLHPRLEGPLLRGCVSRGRAESEAGPDQQQRSHVAGQARARLQLAWSMRTATHPATTAAVASPLTSPARRP